MEFDFLKIVGSIILGSISTFISLLLLRRIPENKNLFSVNWTTILIGLLACYLYIARVVTGEIPFNFLMFSTILLASIIIVTITVNSITIKDISMNKLVGIAVSFGLLIYLSIIYQQFVMRERITDSNLTLLLLGLILSIGISLAMLRFYRYLRELKTVGIPLLSFASLTIGIAYGSLSLAISSSNVSYGKNYLTSTSYIDLTLLPWVLSVFSLLVIELGPILLEELRMKRQEERAKKNKEQFELLLDKQNLAIFHLNQSGYIINGNKTAAELTSYYTNIQSGTMLFKELIQDSVEDDFNDYLNDLIQNGVAHQFETILENGNENSIYVQITLTPTKNKKQKSEIIVIVKDITETIVARKQVEFLAHYDPLTKLPNRHFFTEKVKGIVNQQNNHPALLLLDIDRFKAINDVLGHTIGDKLLVEFSERLKTFQTENIFLARIGGDEFSLLVLDYTHENLDMLAADLLEKIKVPFLINKQQLYITASIGIATYIESGMNVEDLMKHADTAMFRSKESGKNTFTYYNANRDISLQENLELEKDLRKALDQGQFQLYYQPLVSVQSKEVEGFEVLIRWMHPRKGVISPGVFIPIAEEMFIINDIGKWVLENACKQLKSWHLEGFDHLRLSVNVSFIQFYDKDFIETIAEILEQFDLDPAFIQIEITETMAMKDVDQTLFITKQLQKLGINISIDDFGKGYSSLTHIRNLPLNCLKIDGAFIRDIPHSEEAAIIIQTVMAMAHSLNLVTVAEHVELEEQVEFLESLNCNYIQGFYYGKPLPAQEAILSVRNGLSNVTKEASLID
jgi:diguanylate cyclase